MATKVLTQLTRLIECSLCMEGYSLKEHIPKCLPCGHTFCNICLENLNNDSRLTCPNCKRIHTAPQEGVQGFGTNHAITGMMEYSCEKCHNLGQISQCLYCTSQLCTCCVEDHIQSEYKPSVQVSMRKGLAETQELPKKLDDFVDKVNKMLAEYKTFCTESLDVMLDHVTMDDLREMENKVKLYAEPVSRIGEITTRRDLLHFDPDNSDEFDIFMPGSAIEEHHPTRTYKPLGAVDDYGPEKADFQRYKKRSKSKKKNAFDYYDY